MVAAIHYNFLHVSDTNTLNILHDPLIKHQPFSPENDYKTATLQLQTILMENAR